MFNGLLLIINDIENESLQVFPLSTISAICPKVMHGHQHVKQPVSDSQEQPNTLV